MSPFKLHKMSISYPWNSDKSMLNWSSFRSAPWGSEIFGAADGKIVEFQGEPSCSDSASQAQTVDAATHVRQRRDKENSRHHRTWMWEPDWYLALQTFVGARFHRITILAADGSQTSDERGSTGVTLGAEFIPRSPSPEEKALRMPQHGRLRLLVKHPSLLTIWKNKQI